MLSQQVLIFLVMTFLAARAAKEEDNPYEFGFTIDGQQHRHEKKDVKGIIEGEFGFITADGIYHVTVYATDENGNFKILSMRNVRISAPLDGSPLPKGQKIETLKQQQSVQAAPPPSTTPVPVSSAKPPSTPFAFTTQPTAGPSCGSCGYITTKKPKPGDKFPFLTPQFQHPPKKNQETQNQAPISTQQPNFNNNYQASDNPNPPQQPNFGSNYQDAQKNQVQTPNSPQQPNLGNNYQDANKNQVQTPNSPQQPSLGNNYEDARKNQAQTPNSPQQPNLGNNYEDANKNQVQTPNSPQQPNLSSSYEDAQINRVETSPENPNPPQQPNLSSSLINNYPQNLDQNNPAPGNDLVPPRNNVAPPASPQYPVENFQSQNNGNAPQKPASSLSQVSVNSGVIKVPGNADIPIADKYPGMVDGLPAGIDEKDITDLLYKFNYTVGFHGHYEKGYKNGAKIGGYFVTGRDGLSQIVTYVADERGYRPKVRLERLDLNSDLVPKEGTEKSFGLKHFEFVWYPIS